MLVFDVETTTNLLQNPKVGYFWLLEDETLLRDGFVYVAENNTPQENMLLEAFAKRKGIDLYSREDFLTKIFYKYILTNRGLYTGYNNPFDFSRIAIDCSFVKGERFHNGFSFVLLENNAYPRLKIKAEDGRATIEFGSSPLNQHPHYRGRFLDLHTLAGALSGDKHLTLKRAGELFRAKHIKIDAPTHGTITEPYLRYLMHDVLSTFSLYEALIKELARYNLDLRPEEVRSGATLGKQLLRKLGIKNFQVQNPTFPTEILGYTMNGYYGGRSEVNFRKTPMLVDVLDATSMYPTVNILMHLDELLIAERIESHDATEEIQEFLDTVTLENLATMKDWRILRNIAQLMLKDDVLPIRTRFNEKEKLTNIGICPSTSDVPMWYSVSDLLYTKILTGKAPRISRGIKYVPVGVQATIRPATVLGVTLDPRKRNIYIDLVREKQRLKNESKKHPKGSPERAELESHADALKIIINSNCYGIFIETNPEHHNSIIELHGIDPVTIEGHFEQHGSFYNPPIATATTAGARLLLGIIEALLAKAGFHHAFCDTDSMAVPPEATPMLQEYFQQINPYGEDIQLLKIDYKGALFLGISAKRYVLYEKNGEQITIIKSSLHGLGHLLNPFGNKENWHNIIWTDIIKLHHGIITQEQFDEKYNQYYAIGKIAITTQTIWRQLDAINKDKPYAEQIKPFGFMLVGFAAMKGDKHPIKPIAPFTTNNQAAPHEPFIDAHTGKIYQGVEYWQTLGDILNEYINHPESKLDGDIGLMQKKHIQITNIARCNKETRHLDTQILNLDLPETMIDDKTLKKIILDMTPNERRSKGISRETLRQLKIRAAEHEPVVVSEKIRRKLA